MAEKTYADNEISMHMAAALPHWRYENGAIRRLYKTHSWKGTLMLVNMIGYVAEIAWHHPDLTVSYASVDVALSTHSAGGITDKDFALARKIEEIVQWQPEPPLEGTPADPLHAFIKHDR